VRVEAAAVADLQVSDAVILGQARRALLLIGFGFGLAFLVGLLGPSAVAVTLPQRRAWLPPFWFDVHPSPWLVIGLVLAAIVCGSIGIHLALRALAAGWQPRLRNLVGLGAGGVTAVALVPPMGSGDILMYAAYGRVAALGQSPYVTSPADISRLGYDPVTSAVELPWQGTTTVYGPVATWLQEAASRMSGESTHTTVMWLHLTNALAYVVIGLLVLVLAGRDPSARARAALLVLANPVLVWAVVAGGHNDAQAVMFAIAGIVVARRSPLAAGLLVGLGGAVKLNVALFGLALIWGMRRSPRRVAQLCAGATLALVGTYGMVGPQAFDQIQAASRFISSGSQWRLVFEPLRDLVSEDLARTVIFGAALVSMVLMAILLARALPPPGLAQQPFLGGFGQNRRSPGGSDVNRQGTAYGGDDPRPDAVRAAAVLCLAWMVTAPYVLPWYALVAWVPVAVLAASPVDRLLLVWTAALSAAYAAGRVVELPSALQFLKVTTIQDAMPIVLTVLVALLIGWCWRSPARPRSARPRRVLVPAGRD
jgi:hypothetical protein